LILIDGTLFALNQTVITRAAKTNSFLFQYFFLKVLKSLDGRRILAISFIQRVNISLTAGFAIMSLYPESIKRK